jgi:hypothetical protein
MTAAHTQDQAVWLFVLAEQIRAAAVAAAAGAAGATEVAAAQKATAAGTEAQDGVSEAAYYISIAACDALLGHLGPAEPGSTLSQPAARLALQALHATGPRPPPPAREAPSASAAAEAFHDGVENKQEAANCVVVASVVMQISRPAQQVVVQTLVCLDLDSAAVGLLVCDGRLLPELLGAWTDKVRGYVRCHAHTQVIYV